MLRPERRATVENFAVRLGGEFALLSQSELRHRELLAQAEALASNAERALLAERGKSEQLTAAARRAGELAAEAAESAEAAQLLCATLGGQATSAQLAATILHAEVEVLEAFAVTAERQAGERAATLGATQAALEAAQARGSALEAALGARDAALDAAAAREREQRRELEEWKERFRRATTARQDKERQIAVLLTEKNRLSGLLAKKDAHARGLSTVLKQHEEKRTAPMRKAVASARAAAVTTPGALAALAAATLESSTTLASPAVAAAAAAAAAAATSHPDEVISAAEIAAAAAVAGATAVAAAAMEASSTTTGSRPATAAAALSRAPGRWPTQDEAIVSPRIPGVQCRFEGWRTATPEQRAAALRSENGVLLGVLAERDAALNAAHAEIAKLKAAQQALLIRYRNAATAQRKDKGAADGRPASAAATPGRCGSEPRTPPAAMGATAARLVSPAPNESPV